MFHEPALDGEGIYSHQTHHHQVLDEVVHLSFQPVARSPVLPPPPKRLADPLNSQKCRRNKSWTQVGKPHMILIAQNH
jgi:hypothetical protein